MPRAAMTLTDVQKDEVEALIVDAQPVVAETSEGRP